MTTIRDQRNLALRREIRSQPGALVSADRDTREGRRGSDVAVTLPGGDRVAVEVQQNEVSDAEWLDRQR